MTTTTTIITSKEIKNIHTGKCAKCGTRMIRVEGYIPSTNSSHKGEDWGGLECLQCKCNKEAIQTSIVWIAEMQDEKGNVLHWASARSEETAVAEVKARGSVPDEHEGDY